MCHHTACISPENPPIHFCIQYSLFESQWCGSHHTVSAHKMIWNYVTFDSNTIFFLFTLDENETIYFAAPAPTKWKQQQITASTFFVCFYLILFFFITYYCMFPAARNHRRRRARFDTFWRLNGATIRRDRLLCPETENEWKWRVCVELMQIYCVWLFPPAFANAIR